MRADSHQDTSLVRRRALISALGVFFAASITPFGARAGGTGLNVVVVVNQSSSNSVELGNYYCERRQVPAANLLRINWAGGNTNWTSADFQAVLLQPLLAMLADRQLTNQVDRVVLSMDIPFQTVVTTTNGPAINSTTSALFYGLKPEGGTNWNTTRNSYAFSETAFHPAPPGLGSTPSLLTTMITADSLTPAKQLVDQGVGGDAQTPAGAVILEKTSDPARNIRYAAFDNAIFNVRVRSGDYIFRTNSDLTPPAAGLLGFQTGLANFSVPAGAFRAGALADNMTSFGGVIFGPNPQTTLLAFTAAGAAGSYGTVSEPYSVPDRFPSPLVYFYQNRGFSLAECYYQAVGEPLYGLILGDPLCAPFRQNAAGRWVGTNGMGTLHGTVDTTVVFTAAHPDRPLQQVDLFIDGRFSTTLTNAGPTPGNTLSLALNGFPVTYTVPTNATLQSIASDLAALVNSPATTGMTKVVAFPVGDRVELHSLATDQTTTPAYLFDDAPLGPSGRHYRVRYLSDDFPPRLTIFGPGPGGGAMQLQLGLPVPEPYVVQASTNLADWAAIYTNANAGLSSFLDAEASRFPARFYRVVKTPLEIRPRLAIAPPRATPCPSIHIESATVTPYSIESTTNLADWTSVWMNYAGGSADFTDPGFTNQRAVSYRARLFPDLAVGPAFAVLPWGSDTLVQVQPPIRPFLVEVSTNLANWDSLATNFVFGPVSLTTASSPGANAALTTFLSPARPAFLDSPACGIRDYTVDRTPQPGSWMQLAVTKTNGVVITVSVTNQATGLTLTELCRQLVEAVNSTTDLQQADGVIAQDLTTDAFGLVHFNILSRSPGYPAGAVLTHLQASSPLRVTPSGTTGMTNSFDLQARNHLYVSAGLPRMSVDMPFDTTTLADGFHELTAVAYEGTHVRTQTKMPLAIQIQNTPLVASLAALDVPDPAPVAGTYHFQVSANTNDVSVIRLFSTGGLLNTISNQPTATFAVEGPFLGAGLHPVHAEVETQSGLKYRTETLWFRLVSSP